MAGAVRAPVDELAIDDLDQLARHRPISPGTTRRRSASGPARSSAASKRAPPTAPAAFGATLARALAFKGDLPRCGGWIQRVAELLEAESIDCVEQGWLEYGLGFARLFEHGDIPGVHVQFTLAGKIGRRFHDTELTTMARIGEGRMRIYLGEPTEGISMLRRRVRHARGRGDRASRRR